MTLQDYIHSIQNKSIAVIGIGVSNTPLLELLAANGCKVTACDKRSREEMGEEAKRLSDLGIKLNLGETYLDKLNQDIIFRTPGLMPFESHLEAAALRGSYITSEMEVFLSICPCKVIAITGSDGKTTTSSIIAELLRTAGYHVHLGGNIGHPLLCETPEMEKEDIVVLELSSFQLHSMRSQPDVAVITNISPNHLDKHKDYQDYIDSKMAIFQYQNPTGSLILNEDDGMSEYYRASAPGQIRWFSRHDQPEHGTFCENGVIYHSRDGQREEIMMAEEIRLPGEHNLLNYLAAFAAVEGLVSPEICRQVAMDFAGVEHRLEHVRDLHGVEYINDSIASSPTRTIAGLRALKKPPIVICGGYDKKIPFGELGDDLCLYAKAVVLTGATARKIRDAIEASRYYTASGLRMALREDFREAVAYAAEMAESGDIVLLSPACASFDQFKNFAERGLTFKKIVMELE